MPPPKPGPESHDVSPAVRILQLSSVSETLPGGRISFTINVRNVTRSTLHDIVVSDKFNPESIDIALPVKDGGVIDGNELVWLIPELYAGQTWTTTFEGNAKSNLVAGDRVMLLARASGDEIDYYPEALSSVVGVGIAYMPQTGFRIDLILASLFALGALLTTITTISRKRLVALTA